MTEGQGLQLQLGLQLELAYLLAAALMLSGLAGYARAGAPALHAGCLGGLALAMTTAWLAGGNGAAVVLVGLALAACVETAARVLVQKGFGQREGKRGRGA